MTVHPVIGAALAAATPPPSGPLDPEALRAAERLQVAPPEEREPVLSVEDLTVPAAGAGVPVRVYHPEAEAGGGALVYLHGGAFFLGSLDTHDHVARRLANETRLAVVSVGYRLAPEAPYPAALDDCFAVVRWVAEQLPRTGGRGVLALAGDSSGGGLVASVVALAHDAGFDRITHQVLYYPSLDLDFDSGRYPSLRENAEGFGLETAGLKPFNAFYLGSGADPADPLVSPIKREDLSGLPPALIVTAEHDPLRDEGELYGQRLREAGVSATVERYAGATHGFVANFAWIPEYGRVFARTRDFLRSEP